MATAEYMRRHRERIKSGEWVPVERAPLPEPVPLSDEERAEMESRWAVEYRRTVAAWLLRQRSPHTRKAYKRAWEKWVAWCNESGVDAIESPHGTGGVFLAAMQAAGYSDATRAQWRVAIGSCLLELSANGLRVGGDPFARVPAVQVSDLPAGHALTDDEVARVLEAARTVGGQCLTAVLLCAVMGLRAGEAGQVTTDRLERSPWGPVVRVVGKGNKPALVPVPEVVLSAARLEGFPMDGRPMGPVRAYNRIRYLVEKACTVAGVPASAHAFRHWHVTTALAAGVPLERVQDSVRHADPATTQRYNRRRRQLEDHSAHVVGALPVVADHVGQTGTVTGVPDGQ